MVGTLSKLDVREQQRLNTAVQRSITGDTSVLEVMTLTRPTGCSSST